MGLNHYYHDLYPDTGFRTTSGTTVAEMGDQVVLVDEKDIKTDVKPKADPVTGASIWKSIGLFIIIIIAFGYVAGRL
ncbi:hypothetical protein P4216_23215 [Bacillus thuringiensis]|nr:hypothetical protein [Bacillus thuringiensis]